jgi:preprotein translocase subunit YajC
MRRAALLLLLFLVLTFSPNRLEAQVVKGSWTRLDTRPAGERIVVRLRNGTGIICTLRGTTDNELLVAIHSTDEMRIAKTSVAEVTTEAKHKDSLKNGAAWGLGLGIGFGAANGALQGAAAAAGTVVTFTAGGIFIGWLHKVPEVLYKAR